MQRPEADAEDPTTQDRIAVARSFVHAFGAAGEDAFIAHLDPEVEMRGPSDVPEPGPYHGREAVRAWLRGFMVAWDEWHVEPVGFVAAGQSVVVELRHTGRAQGSGIEVSDHDFHVLVMRNGLIARWTICGDRTEAMRAVESDSP